VGDAARFGGHFPPLLLRDIEGQAVITHIFGAAGDLGLAAGMVVTAVDGRSMGDLAHERGRLISASTPQARRSRALFAALAGAKDSPARLAVENHAGTRVIAIPRSEEALFPTGARTRPAIGREQEFGYIDLGRIDSDADLTRAFREFARAPGLLLDMRGYPRCSVQTLVVSRLIAAPSASCSYEIPVRTGTLYATRRRLGQWQLVRYIVEPDRDLHYGGPVVVLIDESAISSSEDFCIYMRNAGRATFVGAPTTGTNGNVTSVTIPGGYALSFTGMRVTYADGRRFQNIGIVPDVPVRLTVAGIRASRDEVLEAGVETLRRLARAAPPTR
jgi:C-terminal processing protease CtpA/Prc